MFDIVALGELLIDFTPEGENAYGISLFARNPGGAPANVLAMNAKLGGKTAFIGKVGKDAFGDYLRATLTENGIDVSGLVSDEQYNTTLAFVQLDKQGDRAFSFYRRMGADIMLEIRNIPADLLRDCRIFHFGSVSMTDDPARAATQYAAQQAKNQGCLISFDPNYRPRLWRDSEQAKAAILSVLPLADILKVSEEEMALLTNETDMARGSEILMSLGGASLVLISLGPRGAYYKTRLHAGHLPTYNTKTVDTTGAGDAFLGAILYWLRSETSETIRQLSKTQIEEMLAFGNAAGALTTERHGAIPAMPDILRIKNCLRTTPLLT